MEYINGDIYNGEFVNKYYRNGKGIMRYKKGLIYNGEWINDKREGKGFLCSNEIDNKIINDNYLLFKEDINMKEIFNLNIINYILKCNFNNDKINGKGILYNRYSENILKNNTIFVGGFENNIKKGKGIIHFINGSYFKGYWKDDNNIDENEEGEFYLNEIEKLLKNLLKIIIYY